jgi:hypothetical protein
VTREERKKEKGKKKKKEITTTKQLSSVSATDYADAEQIIQTCIQVSQPLSK